MKILADENLYEPIVEYLRETGNDVLSIRESFSGISDNKVYELACKEMRVIITMDKDFSRIFRFPPEKCGGIVVLKIYKLSVKDTVKIFKKFFKKISKKDIKSNLITITRDELRIRRMQK